MAWAYLIVAGIFEWGWPVGLKLALADGGVRWGWIAFAALCIFASGALVRFFVVGLIVIGIVGLKLASD